MGKESKKVSKKAASRRVAVAAMKLYHLSCQRWQSNVGLYEQARPLAETIVGEKAACSARKFIEIHIDAISEYLSDHSAEVTAIREAKGIKPASIVRKVGRGKAAVLITTGAGTPRAPTEAGVKRVIASTKIDPASDAFLRSFEWRAARMMAIKRYGPVCQCCGASPKTGAVINVDHIKPRKLFPELALDQDNLQVLCNDCNAGKGNWDQTDWRVAA